MFKQLKHIALGASLAAGLTFGLLGASLAQTASPGAAASAAAAPAPAAAPAAIPTAAAAPAADPHATDNPYGLQALWAQGDFVAKSTLLILVVMSMGSWYVIFTKFFEQSKMGRYAKAAQGSFWSAGSVRQGADTLDRKSTRLNSSHIQKSRMPSSA